MILDLPLSQRRARLELLLADVPAQLTLTPQTADMRQVGDWLVHWTVAAGIEGVVSKRLVGRYRPGRRGWSKYRTRIVTEAIIGGVTGSLREADTLLLGRFDRMGRLRYTGRTHPLNAEGRREFEGLLSPLRSVRHRRAAVVHPWPQPLPASWSGQLDRPEPLEYVQVEPTVVVEIETDVAFEHQRWRHRVNAVRDRPDIWVHDVPLLLDAQECYFGETQNDTEQTTRMLKQTLGWNNPKLRDPHATDRQTWLVLAAYTQLRLPSTADGDLRRPWERPAPPGRFSPARVRRGFREEDRPVWRAYPPVARSRAAGGQAISCSLGPRPGAGPYPVGSCLPHLRS